MYSKSLKGTAALQAKLTKQDQRYQACLNTLKQCVATWGPAYEICNPSVRDMNIEAQVEVGINDWEAECHNGHKFVGETKAKAEANRAKYYGV